jgi:hypothetical protein
MWFQVTHRNQEPLIKFSHMRSQKSKVADDIIIQLILLFLNRDGNEIKYFNH